MFFVQVSKQTTKLQMCRKVRFDLATLCQGDSSCTVGHNFLKVLMEPRFCARSMVSILAKFGHLCCPVRLSPPVARVAKVLRRVL
jgi:hypothetical protein